MSKFHVGEKYTEVNSCLISVLYAQIQFMILSMLQTQCNKSNKIIPTTTLPTNKLTEDRDDLFFPTSFTSLYHSQKSHVYNRHKLS